MAEITQAEREALAYGVKRESLGKAAQLAYDRLKDEYVPGDVEQLISVEGPRLRPSPPATRARILEMFKRGNRKYALPFEKDRLAIASFMGGNWEEYCQIVLEMAILDTLLSIEEKLAGLTGEGSFRPRPDSRPDRREAFKSS
jgi:hypothetical protein